MVIVQVGVPVGWYSTSGWAALRWCYTGRFAMTIFSATQQYNIVATLFWMIATLFQHCHAVLPQNRRCESSHVTSPLDKKLYSHFYLTNQVFLRPNLSPFFYYCNSSDYLCMRTLSKGDGDGNENGLKGIGLDWQNKNLYEHNAFSYISLPSLHDYDMKLPYFKFFWGREHLDTVL